MNSLSEYEQLREENLRERMKILESLDLKHAVANFADAVKSKRKSRPEKPKNLNVKRRSLRLLQRGAMDASPKFADYYNKLDEAVESSGPSSDEDYSTLHVNQDSVKHSSFHITHDSSISGSFLSRAQDKLSLVKKSLDSKEALDNYEFWSNDDVKILRQMSQLKMHGRVKVGGGHCKATSFCFHPSTSKILVLVGCNTGCMWLGDLTEISHGKCTSFEYAAYSPQSYVPCVSIPNDDHQAAYLCAYDGTVKKFDFEKFTFQLVYQWESLKQNHCKALDFLSSTSILVARQQAPFALIDVRSGKNELPDTRNVEKNVNCLNVSPQDKNLFVTSSSTGAVKIWDFRKLSQELQTIEHRRSVRSARFSPLTGRSILTTSYEDTLNVFTRSDSWRGQFRRETQLVHNNNTGRWLTPFQAVWHPRTEKYFICGSLMAKRRVEVFNRSGLCEVTLPDLNAVCSLTGFHPVYDMAIGLNSSTYLHTWIPTRLTTEHSDQQ